jgi:hypothetical protein
VILTQLQLCVKGEEIYFKKVFMKAITTNMFFMTVGNTAMTVIKVKNKSKQLVLPALFSKTT